MFSPVRKPQAMILTGTPEARDPLPVVLHDRVALGISLLVRFVDHLPLALLAILAYATMLFSNVVSHTGTSAVLIPLGMAILPEYQVQVALTIGLAASTALFLPVSTPPNAIAYSTGLLDQSDFRLGGAIIGLLGPAAAIAWVLLWA